MSSSYFESESSSNSTNCMTKKLKTLNSQLLSEGGTKKLSRIFNTVYEEHGILLYRRDCTMVAYGKIYFEA